MAGDLGLADDEVHAKAAEVLGFWFDALMPEQHFVASDSVDTAVRERFADLHAHLAASAAAGWRDDSETLLAAVIVLDQFSRNLFREDGRAFAQDALARELTHAAIARGWDRDLPVERRQFLYLPLMHAEDAEAQALSVAMYEALGIDDTLGFARAHRDVIARFGRFPSRNAALGRETTPEEAAFLSQQGAGW